MSMFLPEMRNGMATIPVPVATISWSMIFSENRYPPRIKSGAGFFGIMLEQLFRRQRSLRLQCHVRRNDRLVGDDLVGGENAAGDHDLLQLGQTSAIDLRGFRPNRS